MSALEYLKKWGYTPEQVQDFYPTPGTASTVMFYTGLDPFSMKPVFVPRTYEEKQMQRALLQFSRPQNAELVRKALHIAHREDLIGFGKDCLVRPAGGQPLKKTVRAAGTSARTAQHGASDTKKPSRVGWAKSKPKGKGKPNAKAKAKRK